MNDNQLFNLKLVYLFFFDEIQFNILYDAQFGVNSNFSQIYNNSFVQGALKRFKKLKIFGNSQTTYARNKDSKFFKINQQIEHLKSFILIHSQNMKNLKDGFNSLKKSYEDILIQDTDQIDFNNSFENMKECDLHDFYLNCIVDKDNNIENFDSGILFIT